MTLAILHRRPPGPILPTRSASRGRAMVRVVAVLACSTWAGPAAAHEFWLAPSRWAPAPRQAVEVGALAGTGFRGERKPYSSRRSVRWVSVAARRVDLAPGARGGELVWARFAPSDAGGAMLAYESDFTSITLPAAEFDDYLALEGLDAPLAARRRSATPTPGRERYRRCAKAWLSGSDRARAITPIGLALEIVPQGIPGLDSVLRARVAFGGQPLAGALVRAWRAPFDQAGNPRDPETRDSTAVAWQGRADARGQVAIPTVEPGEWLVSTVHMLPSRDPEASDWESSWASLAFERRNAGRGRR